MATLIVLIKIRPHLQPGPRRGRQTDKPPTDRNACESGAQFLLPLFALVFPLLECSSPFHVSSSLLLTIFSPKAVRMGFREVVGLETVHEEQRSPNITWGGGKGGLVVEIFATKSCE